jgi:D-threo-aldose 1-dehydrogenase
MEHRRFGRTGLAISRFALGGGIVGGILIHPADEVRLQALQRVVAAGGNWIDTAADYGGGESEKALGRLLPELTPRPMLSTKVRLDTTTLDDLEGAIRRSLETSLTRLGLDRVALFQLHNPLGNATVGGTLAPDVVLRQGGVADVFDKLRQEGYFDWHGVTGLGETAAIVEVLESGRFDTAQVYYNMLNPSAGQSAAQPMPPGWSGQSFTGILDACRRYDVGVMNIRVLAAGILATDQRHGREVVVARDADLEREQARARKLFARLGDGYGTRAQAAIRFALANPDLSTTVVGVETLDQLDEALTGFEAGPLPAAALAEIAACHADF